MTDGHLFIFAVLKFFPKKTVMLNIVDRFKIDYRIDSLYQE